MPNKPKPFLKPLLSAISKAPKECRKARLDILLQAKMIDTHAHAKLVKDMTGIDEEDYRCDDTIDLFKGESHG